MEILQRNMSKSINQPSIKKNFILSTLYEILCVITPFITAPYSARVLGAGNVGIYSFTSSNEMYFSLIAVMGTAAYGKREIARTRDDKELNSKYFWEIELLSMFTSFIALLGWGVFVLLVQNYKLYYLILTINIFSKMFDISWFYQGLEQFKYTVTRNTIVKILGIICLYIFVKTPEDLWIYFLFHVGIAFLGNLSMWISLNKFLVPINFKSLKIFPHLKETLIYFIPTIATSIYTVLDKTLIGVITKDTYQNGYYEQATKLVNIVKTLCFSSLNAVMGARISYLFQQNKFDEIKEKINNSLNFILFMSFGCCFGIIGIAKIFVPIFYGKGYDQVIPLLHLLPFVLIITGISTCLGSMYFIPSGQRKKSSYFIIIGASINLVCNLLFIPMFYSLGAIIGTIIAESIITIFYVYNCNDYINFKKLFYLFYKKLLSSLLMLSFLLFFNISSINQLLFLFIKILLGTLIYICGLLLLNDSSVQVIYNLLIKRGKH